MVFCPSRSAYRPGPGDKFVLFSPQKIKKFYTFFTKITLLFVRQSCTVEVIQALNCALDQNGPVFQSVH